VTIPERLISYLEVRDQARADAVAATLDHLSPRERGLVHDAAVMGYVQGMGATYPPPDSTIIACVVDACLSMPEHYPTITGPAPEHRVQWGIRLYIDGTAVDDQWRDCRAACEQAVRYHAARRAENPAWLGSATLIRRVITTGPTEGVIP